MSLRLTTLTIAVLAWLAVGCQKEAAQSGNQDGKPSARPPKARQSAEVPQGALRVRARLLGKERPAEHESYAASVGALVVYVEAYGAGAPVVESDTRLELFMREGRLDALKRGLRENAGERLLEIALDEQTRLWELLAVIE